MFLQVDQTRLCTKRRRKGSKSSNNKAKKSGKIVFFYIEALSPQYNKAVILKLGSAKGREGLRDTNMRNGGTALFVCTSVNSRLILIVVFLGVIL